MSETKASTDPLWHAGCLEGYAACLSAMSDADHPTVHGDQALALLRDMAKDKELERAGQEGSSTWTVLAEAVVSEKCEEALAVFSRHPPLGSLEVELCFKTARFHACAQPIPRVSRDAASSALRRRVSRGAHAPPRPVGDGSAGERCDRLLDGRSGSVDRSVSGCFAVVLNS
ncbi:unnamed protein product [Ectocarpus sp. 12 AP-2014]